MFNCLLHWVTAEQIDNQAQHKVQLFGTAYIRPRHCLSLICISTSPLLSFNFLPKAETCGRVNATMSWFLRCPTNSLMIEVWISNYIRSEFQITCGWWHASPGLANHFMPPLPPSPLHCRQNRHHGAQWVNMKQRKQWNLFKKFILAVFTLSWLNTHGNVT